MSDTLSLSAFPKLESLNCNYDRLKSLDISNNKKLTKLYCYRNRLTELDLSNNKKLKKLESDLEESDIIR